MSRLGFQRLPLMAISLFLMQAVMPFLTMAARQCRIPFTVHDISYSGFCLLCSLSLSVHLFVSVSLFPKQLLATRGPSCLLLIHQCMPVLPSSQELHFCHTSAVPFKFSKQHVSECCCCCRETHHHVVRHSFGNSRCLKISLRQLP